MLFDGLTSAGTWRRLTVASVLTAMLAGCVDVTADVAVTTPRTASARLTETVAAQFYPMVKAARQTGSGRADAVDSFCRMGTLTENADGSATCVETRQGRFGDLGFDGTRGADDIVFTPTDDGRVRVALSTRAVAQSLTRHATGGTSAEDAHAQRQMLIAYFQGRTLTFRVTGAEITGTNMQLAPSGRAAAMTLPFVGIIEGDPDVPSVLYAIVVPEDTR